MRRAASRLVVIAGTLAIFLLPLGGALAEPSGTENDGGEIGCVWRQSGSATFRGSHQFEKKAIGEAVIGDHRSRGTKIIDPCVTGQVHNIPAAIYAALAQRHPERFEPRESAGNRGGEGAPAGQGLNRAHRYRYVWLDEVVQEFLMFDPRSITNGGRVYGTAYSIDPDGGFELVSYVAAFERGVARPLQAGFANTANEGGTVGGWTLTDMENFLGQAALFRDHETYLIPRLPGEIHSEVLRLNDRGMALVFSLDEDFNGSIALYENGASTLLDFGPDVPLAFFLDLNNQGIVSGTTFIDGLGYRGFRFDSRSRSTMLLEPLPTEPDAWALKVNGRGEVLGYSFVPGALERIGVWDAQGRFRTYFIQGTPEFPTVSNRLTFNDRNTIVITQVTRPVEERNESYLILRPGVRVKLADLVADMPAEHGSLARVQAINNHDDMIGDALTADFSAFSFLLERGGVGP